MITVEVEGVDRVIGRLTELEREQLPFAAVVALTWTARKAKGMLYEQMRSVFDRPTPWVVPPSPILSERDDTGAFRVEQATREKLYATVKLKDWQMAKQRIPADPLLRHHFEGGARVHKALEEQLIAYRFMERDEYVVPGAGARLDAFGNISRGQIQQILAALGISNSGSTNVPTGKRRRKNKVVEAIFWSYGPGSRIARKPTGEVDYESGRYLRKLAQHLPKGVWQRDGRSVKPILIVVKRPMYRKLFDLRSIGIDAVRRHFEKNFRAALKKAIATSGYKGKWR